VTILRLWPLPSKPDPEPVREQLEQLAHDSLAGRVTDLHVLAELERLSPLPEEDAAMFFLDLCLGISLQALPWFEVIPDAEGTNRDEQADDAARTRIDLALDALEGGAS
jgi:hypothetical protein